MPPIKMVLYNDGVYRPLSAGFFELRDHAARRETDEIDYTGDVSDLREDPYQLTYEPERDYQGTV